MHSSHAALARATDYLGKLADASVTASRPLRGPFLACLELRARLLDKFGAASEGDRRARCDTCNADDACPGGWRE